MAKIDVKPTISKLKGSLETTLPILEQELTTELKEIEKKHEGVRIYSHLIKSNLKGYEVSVSSYNGPSFESATLEVAELVASVGERFGFDVSARGNDSRDFGAAFFKHYLLRRQNAP